jgi:hypothetical protein
MIFPLKQFVVARNDIWTKKSAVCCLSLRHLSNDFVICRNRALRLGGNTCGSQETDKNHARELNPGNQPETPQFNYILGHGEAYICSVAHTSANYWS